MTIGAERWCFVYDSEFESYLIPERIKRDFYDAVDNHEDLSEYQNYKIHNHTDYSFIDPRSDP